MSGHPASEAGAFVVARNPQEDNRLPFLLRLPLEGRLVLKARAAARRAPACRCRGRSPVGRALQALEDVDAGWLADQVTRLSVRYPEVQLVFADSRRYAEDWTYRLLTTALADAADESPNG